jgi:hypothetical protein
MKNFFKVFGIIALIAIIGLAFAGCPAATDDPDEGFDASKLVGTWKLDTGTDVIEFSEWDPGTRDDWIEVDAGSTSGTSELEDGIIYLTGHKGEDEDSFKVAFEGEKLRISEATGSWTGIDGLYTKQ